MWESNPRMLDPQTSVLTPSPIPPSTVHMGFEPMISSVTGRRDKPLLQWTKLEEDVGFEPTRGRTA